MKGRKTGKRILALVLALLMAISAPTWNVQAEDIEVGDLKDAGTGLVAGSLDTSDTISLPIKIYDYLSDGMLFEYAESCSPIGYAGDSRTEKSEFLADLIYVMDKDDGLPLYNDDGTQEDFLLEAYESSTTLYYYDVESEDEPVPASFVRINRGTDLTGYNTGEWTGGLPTIKLKYAAGQGTDLDNRRYVAIVYRTNTSAGKIHMSMYRPNDVMGTTSCGANVYGNYTGQMDFSPAGDDPSAQAGQWTYAIYDLKTGSLGEDTYWNANITSDSSLFISLPIEAEKDFDISRIAFFANEERAKNYGEYMITEGSDRGDNRGFGLLRSSRNESETTTAVGAVTDYAPTVKQVNTYVTETQTDEDGNTVDVAIDSIDLSTVEGLGYTLLGTFKDNGIANIGLLESAIGPNGYPVYKKEVVNYVAYLLQQSLEIPERDENGWKNYRYVKGTPSEMYGGVDLATALRQRIDITTADAGIGSYEEAAQKDLLGTWSEVSGRITTYNDAAYFLLNSIFVPGSYNEVQDTFDYLLLSAATSSDTNGKTYIFDAGFTDSEDLETANSAVFYDRDNKTISNSSAVSKKHFYYSTAGATTYFPFLPIIDKNNAAGQTNSPYYQDDGVPAVDTTMDTYVNRDFNYVIVSEGEFVYHENENLFFDFEGDDDVYLFINDELVMDIGSAHSIDGYHFELNNYVAAAQARTLADDSTTAGKTRNDKLSLVEGDTYSFKFYYMERHGYGANMRINTNIKVTDPAMETVKKAYQNGQEVEFGGVVDKDGIIEYSFEVTNSGLENLYNFSFNDAAIGVTLDYVNGLRVTGSNVCDLSGGELDASDLTAILTHPDYDDTIVTFADNANSTAEEQLKNLLIGLNSEQVRENGGGLWKKSTLIIRGIGYKLTEDQKKAGVFDNIVYTAATNNLKTKVLYGQDNMRVFTDVALVYYEWANHQLNVTKADLVQDIAGRIENVTAEKVTSIELTDKDGLPIEASDSISLDEQGNLTIKYTTTGSKIFYIKAAYSHYASASSNSYGIPDSYGMYQSGGIYKFENSHGHVFNIDEVDGEAVQTSTVVTSQTEYAGSNPNWAVSVLLRPTSEENKYQVVDVVDSPQNTTSITMETGDIAMVVHTILSTPGNTNWINRVAAAALKVGEFVHVSDDYLTVTVLGAEQVVRGVVNVTDVKDSVYVLDYGLSVDLLENGELFNNDTVTVPGRSTVSQLLAIGTTEPSYSPNNISFTPAGETGGVVELTADDFDGKFVFDNANQTLKYTPTDFMNGTDSIYVAVLVRESEYTEEIVLGNANINKEVQMYKSVSVLPANVVYYEDDFPAIHYNKEAMNTFVQLDGINDDSADDVHQGSSNLTQSADQDQEYGQDDVYKDNANSDKSGNSITQITFTSAGEVAYFDFTGTGFELISRTNAFDSALFSLKVQALSYDGSGNATVGNTVKNIPVITEFDQSGDGGKEEIYQVPVIRVKDLTYGSYRVTITGIPTVIRDENGNLSRDEDGNLITKATILYVDGIRIFQPIAESEHYNSTEKGVIFAEVRNLILAGQAAVAGYSYSENEDEQAITVSTGTVTWTENRNSTSHDESTFEGNRVESANDYLMLGPNNEVYMDGDYEGTSALVFYVNEVGTGEHNLQIALHAIDKGQFYGTYSIGMEAFVVYGAKTNDGFAWMPLVTTVSGTEQYYTIDYTQCPFVADRGYQVAIMVDSGMVSYTSLKYTGLEIGTMSAGEGELPTLEYENGILKDATTEEEVDPATVPAFLSLRGLLSTSSLYLDEDTLGDNVVIEDIEGDNSEEGGVKEGILYQKRNNSDVRLIAFVDDLTAYSKVSFTLTINGEESTPLECTTAYAGLYSNGILKTTKDIYGEDGYFVTYKIDGYIAAFGGQEVTITVTYTTVTGETITDVRTVTIE